jgi:hypothetical protein
MYGSVIVAFLPSGTARSALRADGVGYLSDPSVMAGAGTPPDHYASK